MVELSINPPPSDARCECCGKHVSELKPFGKAGDPLVGDFDGALLVKTFRTMAPHKTEKELEVMFDGHCGEDKNFYEQAMSTIEASWECRECVILLDEEFFKTRADSYRLHNSVRIEFVIDCGNCTMNKDERAWYVEQIQKLCETRASKLVDIKVYD